ncbi:MAG TPA: hypothetical protein PLU36_08310, partial [Chitinophagaceae bacterium]|nr:hypothetical protein [Chitinophagaceae bacterium]
GDFAGLVGGPTAEQIYNDSAFERTRENMSEFGGCASAGKAVRVGLSQIIKQMSDSRLTGRLTALMKQINLEDTANPRGQRSIEISAFQNLFNGFNFDRNVSLNGIFNAPYTLTNATTRDSADFVIPAFNPANLVNAPAGATHFRLVNAIVTISDWVYNPATGSYEPTDPTLNSLSDISYSAYLPLNATAPATTVTTTLPGAPTMTATVSVLNCVGIEFYQQVGGNYYLFAQGNALRCDTVF